MRCVVCAYSEVGYECLAELIDLGVEIALVVTHADAAGENRWFGSVFDLATSAGIPVAVPDDVNSPESIARIAAARPDYLFSFYFRHMLKPAVLGLPTQGALNLHGSLLPRYRGRAPVNWVLVNGEAETGVTLHYMDEKPDHGDVVAQRVTRIERDDTALTLTVKLAALGRALLRDVIPLLEAGSAPRTPQDHACSSYFGGRRPADGEIDWREPAERIRNLVRAVTAPWPGAFSRLRSERLTIQWCETGGAGSKRDPGEIWLADDGAPWVATGNGSILLARVQRGEGPPVSGADWARSESIRAGERFAVSGAAGRDPVPESR